MKIVHVAPLVTPDGAYGGPITVALNQLRELAARGHDVELVAGAEGYPGPLPADLDGVPVRLFPVRRVLPGAGYAGLASPGVWRYVRHVPTDAVVQVHVARDLVTMPAAWLAARRGIRVVLQPHGMVDRSERRLARVFDALLTHRTFASASAVLTLTAREESELAALGLGQRTVRVPNGVQPTSPSHVSGGGSRTVLFLARLHPRKRALAFVEMAGRLGRRHPDVRFRLIGPDEGDGPAVRVRISELSLGEQLTWEGAIPPDRARRELATADLYVLPSVGEVFPMTVLEAMVAGTPTVVTTSNGLAEELRAASAALVVDESLDGLVAGVGSLLGDSDALEELGMRGASYAESHWGMATVGDLLETAYAVAGRNIR